MSNNTKNIFLDVVSSLPDERDYRYAQRKIDLRNSVDLREWDSPVEDQGYVGSCVGNAIANAYELMVLKLYPDRFVNLSRLFIYYNSRLFDNSIKEDIGTYIRDGLKAASKYGVCNEKLWPYIEDKFDDQPTPACYVDAAQRLITRYETLYTLRDMLEVLNDSRPIVVGMYVYDDFISMGQKTSVIKVPNDNESAISAHAVTLVGYDLPNQMFLAKNSFGKDWGDNGYFWITFEYVRTQVFEKWCFDISSQLAIDIDSAMPAPARKQLSNQLAVKIGPEGVQIIKR